MAITAGKVKITIRGILLNQQVELVQWYTAGGAAFLTADATAVGEAYWNDIKDVWRPSHLLGSGDKTTSILVSEPGSTGAFGEYAIPIDEQNGTRPFVGTNDFEPSFVAAGVRLSVGTRATRPGQKRFWGVTELDVDGSGYLSAAYVDLIEPVAVKFSENIILGAPVATGVLYPIICRVDRATGAVTAQQDVTGHVINPAVTSQVSRKIGRGR